MKQVIAHEPLAALQNGTKSVEAGRTISSPGSPESKFYVLTTNITFPSSARGSDLKAGFQILSSPSDMESTTIYYQFSNESIIIDRSNSSAAAQTSSGIDARNDAGRLQLFDVVMDGEEVVETLELMVVVDGAVVEVHANGRIVMSTWVRSWYVESREIRFFHEGAGSVMFGDVEVTEGLFNAWPERGHV